MTRVAPKPLRFTEVKPQYTDTGFQKYLERGLARLAASPTKEAKRTLAAITSGRVKVDLFSDLTAHDFRHMRHDLWDDNVHLKLADYERLHDKNSGGFRAISKTLNGYMWDDRVYVHRELSSLKLASTLVHEVTHVLNKSEEHYRGGKQILLEEYRSFYAEKKFAGIDMTPARSKRLKQYIIDQYELKNVTVDDVPDVPPGA